MFTTVRSAMDLIGHEQRSRWLMLVFVAVAASIFEMLGAALVYVLITLVADPMGDLELPVIGDVRSVAAVPDRNLLLGLIAVMAVFFVLRGTIQVGSVYLQRRVAENAGARLANRLVEGYLRWPYESHLHRSSSEFVRNGQQAVQQLVTQVFMPMIRVAAEALLAAAMLSLMLAIAPVATGVAVVVVGGSALLLLLVLQPRLKRLGRTAHEMQRATLSSLQQALEGIRDIKMLGRERYFSNRFARSRLRLARVAYLRDTLYEVPRTAIELAVISFVLILLAVSVSTGSDVGEALPVLGLFAYAGLRLQPSVQRTIASLNSIRFSAAPLADLHADLQLAEALPAKRDTSERLPFEYEIVLQSVAFRYRGADRDALTDVNLTIRPGEQIGICGPTGGGKTTLVDLITGLLVPTSGRITVDGRDLAPLTGEWQRALGVVPQTPFLLDDTLRRNVAFGVADDDIDGDALSDALEMAQLREFVASLPFGLETHVGERGLRISGGQRQRIAIARALYHRPAILIFDEGTSALDNATEANLMAAIERLRGAHTIILIAHRLSTVRASDRVIFVDDCRIAGEGTFDALAQHNDRFRALASPL